jgi:hypothetical protein
MSKDQSQRQEVLDEQPPHNEEAVEAFPKIREDAA